MTQQFQLVFYHGKTREMMSIEEHLARREKGEEVWNPYLGFASILLEIEGKNWWEHGSTIGDLSMIVVQLEAAYRRLSQNKVAIIRSAFDDSDVGAYFLLEPSDQRVVNLSMFSITDTNYSFIYPVSDNHPQQVEVLYNYVQANREQLMHPFDKSWENKYFQVLPFTYDDFLISIKREAELGRRLYDVLGVDFSPDF